MPYPKMTDELPEDEPETDDVLVYARRIARWQIQNIEENPSMNQEKASARARDARTLNELVRTLERLDALEKNRASTGRKTKVKDDAELKAALVEHGEKAFADDLHHVIGEKAISDFKAAARCYAFGLHTASGYHSARAVEAALETPQFPQKEKPARNLHYRAGSALKAGITRRGVT